ncbi:spermatogenesis associated 6-like protein [Antennarius striatus]|uniref:spermatogenesis associated 6-like protein n=1 Tax=Antennarius striatus TaxID=241820 RepID=UPI0035B3FEDB
MSFEKTFRHAVDPGDMALMLECETVRMELVQLVPPVGDTLASFEEDARRFLFPEPRLRPSFSGVDREVLMTRAPHFPGIAPRLEFSTKTTIFECSADAETNTNMLTRPLINWNRKQSSRVRSSSPLRPQSIQRRQGAGQSKEGHTQSHAGIPRTQSLSPLTTETTKAEGESQEDSESSETLDPPDCHRGPEPFRLWKPYNEWSQHSRSVSVSHREWEEVQKRVRGLLMTPKAVQRLVNGATHSEIEQVLARRSISPGPP